MYRFDPSNAQLRKTPLTQIRLCDGLTVSKIFALSFVAEMTPRCANGMCPGFIIRVRPRAPPADGRGPRGPFRQALERGGVVAQGIPDLQHAEPGHAMYRRGSGDEQVCDLGAAVAFDEAGRGQAEMLEVVPRGGCREGGLAGRWVHGREEDGGVDGVPDGESRQVDAACHKSCREGQRVGTGRISTEGGMIARAVILE